MSRSRKEELQSRLHVLCRQCGQPVSIRLEAELGALLPFAMCIVASIARYAALPGPWWTVAPVLVAGMIWSAEAQLRLPLVRR
jgi:hypothetical protein